MVVSRYYIFLLNLLFVTCSLSIPVYYVLFKKLFNTLMYLYSPIFSVGRTFNAIQIYLSATVKIIDVLGTRYCSLVQCKIYLKVVHMQCTIERIIY